MRTRKKALSLLAVLFTAFGLPVAVAAQTIPNSAAIDAEVQKIMTRTRARGIAVAVLDHGKVGYVHAYGIRNAKRDPLTTDTVIPGHRNANQYGRATHEEDHDLRKSTSHGTL